MSSEAILNIETEESQATWQNCAEPLVARDRTRYDMDMNLYKL